MYCVKIFYNAVIWEKTWFGANSPSEQKEVFLKLTHCQKKLFQCSMRVGLHRLVTHALRFYCLAQDFFLNCIHIAALRYSARLENIWWNVGLLYCKMHFMQLRTLREVKDNKRFLWWKHSSNVGKLYTNRKKTVCQTTVGPICTCVMDIHVILKGCGSHQMFEGSGTI